MTKPRFLYYLYLKNISLFLSNRGTKHFFVFHRIIQYFHRFLQTVIILQLLDYMTPLIILTLDSFSSNHFLYVGREIIQVTVEIMVQLLL